MRRVLCLRFAQWRSQHGNRSARDITASVWPFWQTTYEFDELKDEVHKMMEAGSRYRNIDQHIGIAATFVLGTDIHETV